MRSLGDAATGERPQGWRGNFDIAAQVARGLGIDPAKYSRTSELLRAIDRADGKTENATEDAPKKKDTGLRVGLTPNTASRVTVKDGVIYIGGYEALDYETGEPVTVPNGSTAAQVAQALLDAGAIVAKRIKFFGLKENPERIIDDDGQATVALDSFADSVQNPETVEDVRAAVDTAIGARAAARLIESGRIFIHASPESLPEELAIAVSRSRQKISGLYDPKSKTLHLVAAYIQRGTAGAKLQHEGWHMFLDALRVQDGTRYKAMMKRLALLEKFGTAGRTGEFFRKGAARIPAKDRASEERRLNELAAYAIEEYERAPRSLPQTVMKWARDFIAAIRAALVLRGFNVTHLTEADMAAIARRFLRQQADVKQNLTAQSFPDGEPL
ncbi:MAG: hypothetical protein LBE06_08650, partial [Azoarcus sp.]|nr:hypothetical protein [Azoarcus sp.]